MKFVVLSIGWRLLRTYSRSQKRGNLTRLNPDTHLKDVKPMLQSASTFDQSQYNHLQAAARDHLWMHFTRHSTYATNDVPVIVRGEGAYVYDIHGNRYLDALAGLFVSQLG